MLEKYRKNVFTCSRCGACRQVNGRTVCPIYAHSSGFESDYTRGKIRIAQGMLEKKFEISGAVIDKIFQCTMCGNCLNYCFVPQELNPIEVFRAMRAEITERGYKLPNGLGNSTKIGTDPKKKISTEWITPGIKISKKADTAYFPGCITSIKYPKVAQSFAKILNKVGIEFTVPSETWCCGDMLFLTGQFRLAEEIAKHNVETLTQLGIWRLVLTCAGGYRAFKQEYPKIFEMDFEVLHSSELLARLVEKGKLKFKRSFREIVKRGVREKVTYQDPCELGRYCGVYEPPRRIITNIPRVELVEMKINREHAWCCGGGAGVKLAYPNLALEIAEDILNQAEDVGANTVITCCPNCMWGLKDAIEKTAAKLKVADLNEFLVNRI